MSIFEEQAGTAFGHPILEIQIRMRESETYTESEHGIYRLLSPLSEDNSSGLQSSFAMALKLDFFYLRFILAAPC